MNVQNRDYSTHISGQIADGQWEVIDLIVDQNLKSINETREITLWDINVCLYVSAITLLEFNGLLKQKSTKKKEEPGWLVQSETKIEAIRKHLSRIDVVLKCKEKKSVYEKNRKILKNNLKNALEKQPRKIYWTNKCN